MASTKAVPEIIQQRMIEVYLTGRTMKEVSEQFGYSQGAGWRALRRHGILSRSRSIARRVYAVDETYFDDLDSEDKAYWLGFLTADGGIVRNQVILILSERDGAHLVKFQKAIAAEHPVIHFHDRGHGYTRIIIHSQRLVESLFRLGISERKSFLVKPCRRLTIPLLRHYWRGVLDGDGWLSRHARSNWTIGLSGNEMMCRAFQRFADGYVNSKASVLPHGKIFTISYTGTRLPYALTKLLYEGANVFLDRKMSLAQEILNAMGGFGVL